MTPNELFDTIVYEMLIVPVAWSGSDLPIGDTPISILFRVVISFFGSWMLSAYLIHLILRPVDMLWHKIRRKEYNVYMEWEGWTAATAMWGGLISVMFVWAIWMELLNQ